jgi:LPXTG-site transpeptidase (sortase) family protein
MERIVMVPIPMRLRRSGDHWPSNHWTSGSWLQIFFAITLVLGFVGMVPSQPVAAATQFFVQPSGHTLSDPFLGYWTRHEGRVTFGFPVTEPVLSSAGQRQYFQYGVIEAQSEGSSKRLRRVPVGLELIRSRLRPERTVGGHRVGGIRPARAFIPSDAPASTDDDSQFFTETGFAVSGRIKSFYDVNGGQRRFGLPLSDPYVTAGVTVQWFEYGRIEVLPDGDPVVRLAPIGVELAHSLRADTSQVAGYGLPQIDLERFRLFHGDGTIPEAFAAFDPTRISMPAVGIYADIEQVGIVDGVMGVPQDPWKVGWYPGISTPGEATNVVLSGHKDWWNIGPTIFANLSALVPGNRIYLVGEDGRGFTYEVREIWSIGARTNAQDIVSDFGVESLTLITCSGTFNGVEYDSRLVVRAVRI